MSDTDYFRYIRYIWCIWKSIGESYLQRNSDCGKQRFQYWAPV